MKRPLLLALMRKECLILLRDPHGLAVLFVMPMVLILVLSLALRDVMSATPTQQTPLLWLNSQPTDVDTDDAYFIAELHQRLRDVARFKLLDSQDHELRGTALAQTLSRGNYIAAVHVPVGLKNRLLPDSKLPLLELTINPAFPIATVELFKAQLQGVLIALKAEFVSEDVLGVPEREAAVIRQLLRPDAIEITTRMAGSAALSTPDATQQSVPAWIVFGMFFVVFPLSTSVINERSEGTLQRLALLNAGNAAVLAAKVPVYLSVTLIQALLMLAVGVWLVPLVGGAALHLNGSVLALLPVILATGFAAIGVALLVAVWTRTVIQATTIGGAINLLLAVLGGVMVPKVVMPAGLQLASLASPMSWALDGFWDVILRGTGVAATLPECLGLAVLGSVCFGLAVWRLQMDRA